MANIELLQAGIAAAKAGDTARATALFAQVVKSDPASEPGWLWLGKCCTETARKEFCFRQVLKINPYNMEAVEQLARLAKPAPIAPPFSTIKPLGSTPLTSKKAVQPSGQAVSPFLFGETSDEPAVHAAEEKVVTEQPVSGSLLPQAPKIIEAGEPIQSNRPSPKGKKSSKFLAGCMWFTIIAFLICAGGAVYLYFSGLALDWLPNLLPAGMIPTATSAPLLAPTAIQKPTASPTVTVSPTPALPTSSPTPKATVVYTPVFKSTECKFDPPAGVVVNCGYVSVPEDRTNEHSKSIQLALAIYHSTSPDPASDPVVFLQGGPGGEAVMLSANAYELLVKPFLSKRDFIAFDQRGTGLSIPALGCDELETVYKQDIHGQIPDSSRDMIYTNAFRSCHGSMTISGINLNSYTTAASVEDLKDIVTVLGYKQVNLYGASYGTRLALLTMKNHPEIVKSAVLDSVVPVESKLFNDDPVRYGSSLQAMFDGCASDLNCKTVYPDLKTVFWNLVNHLDANPITVTAPLLTGGMITEQLNGADLIGVTLALLKASDLIPSVPESIYRIKAGDYSTFVAMQSSLPYEFEGIDIGLYISVMCHEHILATTPQALQTAMDSEHDIGRYFRLPFFGNADTLFNTCKVWGAVPPVSSETDPVISDIPSLVIEGRYDPATPPIFGKQVAAHLSHSYYMEFPNQGHTPTATDTSGCAFSSMLAFVDNPTQSPDISCLQNINSVSFIVPYTGNPPLELDVESNYGFSAKMPMGWKKLMTGIYLRDNSPLDITQIAVLQTMFSSTDLLKSLSSKLYGYEGFDSAPVQTGVRQANGLDWSLYQTSSYGRPVELAMANYSGGSIVVLLFCHKDEHDALYQTVFLPIIDSVQSTP